MSARTAIVSLRPAGHCGGCEVVARDSQPQQRLDHDAIGGGRGADGAEAGHFRNRRREIMNASMREPTLLERLSIWRNSADQRASSLRSAEQPELRRIARGLGEAEMAEGVRR